MSNLKKPWATGIEEKALFQYLKGSIIDPKTSYTHATLIFVNG